MMYFIPETHDALTYNVAGCTFLILCSISINVYLIEIIKSNIKTNLYLLLTLGKF